MKNKIIKIALLVAVFVITLGFSTNVQADRAGYYIKNYNIKAHVNKDNTVDVKETIEVKFTAYRHGIYRNIPEYMYVKRKDSDGKNVVKKYANKISDLSIGKDEYDTETENDELVIKIGDPDREIIGNHTYKLSYKYEMPDDRLDTGDFFFYSLLGAQWNCKIKHFSFDVSFEKKVPDKAWDNFYVYSGPLGSDDNELDVQCYDNGEGGFYGDVYDVPAKKAISVFIDLPEGYFVGERDHSAILTYIFLALGLLALLYLSFKILTAKQDAIVETVEFYPPDGISSAEVGTIIDESADEIDLVSLVPYWASKGYITIEETKKDNGETVLKLHKVKDLDSDAPMYQKTLFKAFFKKDSITLSDLGIPFAKKFNDAITDLRNEFTDDKELSTGEFSALGLAFLPSFLLSVAVIFSSRVSSFENLIWAIFVFAPLLGTSILRICTIGNDVLKGKGLTVLRVLIAAAGFLVAYIGIHFSCTSDVDNFLPETFYMVVFAILFVEIQLLGRLVKPTEYKKSIIGKVLGFRRFIETAELSRLEALVDENPEYFYDVLPYAMAFGLTNKWSDKFKSLPTKQPSWYTGTDSTMFNYYYLSNTISRSISQPIADSRAEAAAAAKASSGGGGFSGGGGGGGGGGSW